MTTTLFAHFDGKALVLDGPVDLPIGTPLRVQVAVLDDTTRSTSKGISPTLDVETILAMASDPKKPWQPLDIDIDPELANAIALDPEFNIEES